MINLDKNIINQIVKLCNQYSNIEKILLFGSRARCDNSATSDIDLALFLKSKNPLTIANFSNDLENIDTLLKFDIIEVDDSLSEALIKNINQDGIVLCKN